VAGVDSQTWGRIAGLFDELVELSGVERAERVAALAREDPALAREIEVLLHADSVAEGILEATLMEVTPELARAAVHGAWETRAGTMFGPYRLLTAIGEGGMGEVWRAERADGAYRQEVAIKLLKRGLDTRAILRRFLQERSILARLEHPGIVRVFDGGMSPDGRPWYAMACVEGTPLIVHAARQGLDLRQRIALLARVADAVAYAHARLVVHRDLKPGNILVDAQGQPHLLDFGIAKVLEDTGDGTVTGSQVRVLSPAYAAPEQILGQPVGTATDVYALGVIAHELLTGVLPHRRSSRDPGVLVGELAQTTAVGRASQAIGQGEARALERVWGAGVDGRRLARQVAGDLDLVLATALRPEPERRYAGAAAFAADLRAWLDRRPVAARPDSAGYRLRRFARRHAVGVAAGGLVAIALLAGLALALWQAGIARAQAERAEQQARRAEATKDFVVSAFAGLSPTAARDGSQLRLTDFLDALLRRLDGALADAPEARIELRTELAKALQELGELDAAHAAFAQAEREALAQPTLSPQALGNLLHAVAVNHQRRGDLDAAERDLQRAVAALSGEAPGVARERIAVRTTRAYLANDRGRYREGLREYETILEDRRSLLGVEDSRMAVDRMNLCVARWWLADYARAEQDCLRAWALLEGDAQSPRARFAWVGNALALVLSAQGRWQEAEQAFAGALSTVRQTLGDNHAMARLVAINQAALWLERGDHAAALDGIDAVQTQPGFASLAGATQRSALSVRLGALIGLGRLAEADALVALLRPPDIGFEPALTLSELRTDRRLAELRLRQGDLAEAGAKIERVVEGYLRLDLPDHDDLARALRVKAEIADLGGDAGSAARLRGEARRRAAQALGESHPLVVALAGD